MNNLIDLITLSVKTRTARCRVLGSEKIITVRLDRIWDLTPGWITTIRPHKQWHYAGHPYLSGAMESTRLDIGALGLVPLRVTDMGLCDPQKEYWGEPDEPIDDWAKPIISRGPRPEFEMEQVLPGSDPEDPFSDPITESNELKETGHTEAARRLLMALCQADLRCLDAQAHLGNLVFNTLLEYAIRHYEVGWRIGELSLGKGFEGLLPWGFVDNRPFLRCLHGYGLCLWRLERFDEAAQVFDRLLWLNPSDELGVRFLIEAVRDRKTWEK